MSRQPNTFMKAILFRPSVVRRLKQTNARVDSITLAGDPNTGQPESIATDFLNTGSFRYDPPGFPLKNTQQLNVDWSRWENHTFFNSARVKVQTAFDKIVNQYPFDGTRAEFIEYVDSLDGFTKYVLGLFPKNKGCLKFDRTYNSYLQVNDIEGVGVIKGKRGASGKRALDFSYKPFTVEVQVFVPSGSQNDNEVILQKISNSDGLTIALSSSKAEPSPLGRTNIFSYLSSGSTVISASVNVPKGVFNRIATVYDRNDTGQLHMYVNGLKTATSRNGIAINDMNFATAPVTIGSGTLHTLVDQTNFLPAQNLSGALDDLRFFHERRTDTQLRSFAQRTIYTDSEGKLRLYLKFNEPSGSFGDDARVGNESLVLDYSGYGLHTSVTNFNMSLRNTGTLPATPSTSLDAATPVLFPSFDAVSNLGTELLLSASQYDYNNPNLITNLVPKHYFLEASEFEGYESEYGDIAEDFGYTTDAPGGGKMGSPQIIAALLYTWADAFDELKMFVDEFGRVLKVDYLSDQTISDQLLPFLARYYGLNLPNAYAAASLSQLIDGQDIGLTKLTAVQGLQGIQNTLWRRVLSDLPELLASRGTRHSIEVLFRNLGIRPDGAFRIREYGGSRTQSISDSFERRNEIAAMLDFSGSLGSAGTIDGSGKASNRPLVQSYYLSASRIAAGTPLPKGTFTTAGISNEAGDGLFTSGSWSVEGVFKFEPRIDHPLTQSLLRLQTTGSQASGASNNWLVFNTTATTGVLATSTTGTVVLHGRPIGGSTAKVLELQLTGVNILDGGKWHVSFGRTRNDQVPAYVSSSYFLRAGRMGPAGVQEYHATSTYYNDYGDNILNTVSGSTNAFGAFVTVGSQSLLYDSSLTPGGFLNTVTSVRARYVNFTGKCSGLRFFSKALSEKETLVHIRNFKSLGTEDPLVNFSFNAKTTGSFERLRLDLSIDQPVTKSNVAGDLHVFDFSQNNLHASGSGFEIIKEVIKPERFDYMILSPRFELGADPNKVRIRSFQQTKNLADAGMKLGSRAPLHRIPDNEEAKDDRRLAIDVSCVQALNEDIINIFATFDILDNAIGNPELVFSQEYRDLRNLRRMYFNRLTDKVSLTKFFQFFQWFDATVGDLIEEFIPHTTRYLGTNFVVESHALERPKFTYSYSNMYVGILDRREASLVFMQQFLGSIRKF